MSNILKEIIDHKRTEVNERKALYPIKLLEQSIFFKSPGVSLKRYLLREDKAGIIAEIKRKSPSKGIINNYINIEKVAVGYMQAGASALSVLTDTKFFGGKNEDLTTARKFNYCPILRKDFIVDEYQIIEAKSIGADAILLLGNVLTKEEIKQFTLTAHALGLEVLLELRDEKEIDSINEHIELVGINNRNLVDFKVDLEQSFKLAKLLPSQVIKIAESGIDSAKTIIELKTAGFRGFLIGETFMRSSRPEEACAALIKEVDTYKNQLSTI
jgi:indole-3-glycerol phosphate synthase